MDSTPLSLLCQPGSNPDALTIALWKQRMQAVGHAFYIPEVIDYEVRRELVRSGKTSSVTRLDLLKLTATYVPINSQAMLLAADLWAQARNAGQSTGDPKKLDIDVILAAQTLIGRRNVRATRFRFRDHYVERRASFPLRSRCARMVEPCPVRCLITLRLPLLRRAC